MEISLSLKKALEKTFEDYLDELFELIVLKYGKQYNFDILDLHNKFNEYNIIIKSEPDKSNNNKSNNNKINNNNRKRKYKFKNKKDEDKCRARIWGNAYVDIKNNIYGKQCQNYKKDGQDYCLIHKLKNKHGNWDQEPSESIKAHFKDHNQKKRLNKIYQEKFRTRKIEKIDLQ